MISQTNHILQSRNRGTVAWSAVITKQRTNAETDGRYQQTPVTNSRVRRRSRLFAIPPRTNACKHLHLISVVSESTFVCVVFTYLDGFSPDGADDRRSDDAAWQVLGRPENHVLCESLRECVRVGARVDELRGHHVDQVIVHPSERRIVNRMRLLASSRAL